MKNTERIDKIKTALGCETNAELTRRINDKAGKEIVYDSTIPRWKRQGMNKPMECIIDLLLDETESLKITIQNLKKKLKKTEKKMKKVA